VLTDVVAVPIRSEADIVSARQSGRRMAAELGFSASQLTMIATAISELARNVVNYAGSGEVLLELRESGSRRGILVVARDEGPGIPDIEAAMQDGFSTGRSLGLGLPGARRLMDEFDIVSTVGEGTTVTATKWAAG
jgi:serine/threonine-protein kinase RsbT